MRPIENKCMLITYADSLGGDLRRLEQILERYFSGAVEGVHILPFYPSSGDRGFAVIRYDEVDPAFGTWEDIRRLAERYTLACDFMVNHISVRSPEFLDYSRRGDASPCSGLFIRWDRFWPGGEPAPEDLEKIYFRKPGGPRREFALENGSRVTLWNTFFEEQVDIDPYSPAAREYFAHNLGLLASRVPLIRFDAFAYCSKVPGTSCFFVEPQIWDILKITTAPLEGTGTRMLAEIHEQYHIQKALAEQGHYVYDFALPMLVLHAIESGSPRRLVHWLKICPKNQFTTLDTHDGIGVVDARLLLSDEELGLAAGRVMERFREQFRKLPGEERAMDPFTNAMVEAPDPRRHYQLPGTFFSAMGEDEGAYLLARAIQLFTPGIPMIYYVGLLAGTNDFSGLREGRGGREINRHNYTEAEAAKALERPVVQNLLALMRFRNTDPAFCGDFAAEEGADGLLRMTWEQKGVSRACLTADLRRKTFLITADSGEGPRTVFDARG